MDNPDYVWRPDPKGERIPKTLFGMPVRTVVLKEEPEDWMIVLGTLDEYIVQRPITDEELNRLVRGRAVLIGHILGVNGR